MANRVLIGAKPGGSGLRVSRPGHDVTNPNLTGQQLAFDSDWLASAVIHLAGTISVPQGSVTQYTDVSYGTTFSDYPAVIAYVLNPAVGSVKEGWQSLALGAKGAPYLTWTDNFASGYLPYKVFTNKVSFMSNPDGARTIRYFIMRPL